MNLRSLTDQQFCALAQLDTTLSHLKLVIQHTEQPFDTELFQVLLDAQILLNSFGKDE